VKIDESFIASIPARPGDLTITRSIIDLATNLALDAVAEGVEDGQTWNELIRLGCHTLQGHHLSEPMPIDHLPAWLRNYNQQRGNSPRIPRARNEAQVFRPSGANS
jgi:EAL domain-containing protein (putative c-di-GMP-specific phosphodiesterase class I)